MASACRWVVFGALNSQAARPASRPLLTYLFVCLLSQVHVFEDGRFRVFSRAGEDSTERFREIGALVATQRRPGVGSVIVEGEAVARSSATGDILPFQTLSARARYVEHHDHCIRASIPSLFSVSLSSPLPITRGLLIAPSHLSSL
jgi:hypothetical protein